MLRLRIRPTMGGNGWPFFAPAEKAALRKLTGKGVRSWAPCDSDEADDPNDGCITVCLVVEKLKADPAILPAYLQLKVEEVARE